MAANDQNNDLDHPLPGDVGSRYLDSENTRPSDDRMLDALRPDKTRPDGAAAPGPRTTGDTSQDETQPYGLEHTQAEDADVTQAYGSDVTQAYGSDVTQAYGVPDSTAAPDGHGLTTGQQITLGSESYLVEACISSGTGEAAVYRIWTAEGEARVLKLYRGFSDARHEPNPEALRRIQQIEDDDILRLYSFGTGSQKYLGRFCYEIAAFAQGGTLLDVPDLRAKYTRTFVEREVVPQLIKGIRALHSRQIYHCDLKPQNVFYLDRAQQDLVIGDYGSAKTRDAEAARSLAVTSMAKGTDFYLAPEQARGVVSEKNDYYSMGMVLLHLLYPEAASRQNLHRILERQMMGQPIWEFRRDAGRLNELIAGLTLANHVLRWGYAEVERWLDGKAVTVSYGGAVHVDSVKPIKLGKAVIRTEADLVAYIEDHDDWYELLIEDRQGWQALLIWLSEVRDLSEKRRLEELVREYQAIGATEEMGSAYVRVGILRFLDPERPIRVDMQEYDFSGGEVREQAKRFFRQLYDMRHATDIKHIRLWVFEMELVLNLIGNGPGLGESLRSIAESIPGYQEVTVASLSRTAFDLNPQWAEMEISARIQTALERIAVDTEARLLLLSLQGDVGVRPPGMIVKRLQEELNLMNDQYETRANTILDVYESAKVREKKQSDGKIIKGTLIGAVLLWALSGWQLWPFIIPAIAIAQEIISHHKFASTKVNDIKTAESQFDINTKNIKSTKVLRKIFEIPEYLSE